MSMSLNSIREFVNERVCPDGAFSREDKGLARRWAEFLNTITQSQDYVVVGIDDETSWAFGMYGVCHVMNEAAYRQSLDVVNGGIDDQS